MRRLFFQSTMFFFCVYFLPFLGVAHSGSGTIENYQVTFFESYGWTNPLPSPSSNTGADYFSDDYRKTEDRNHVGIDLTTPGIDANTVVKAIAKGTVVRAEHRYNSPKNTSHVAVRHETNDGTTFIAVYGHCKPIVSLGVDVVAGEELCKIREFNSFHLHFGVFKSQEASWDRWLCGGEVSSSWCAPGDDNYIAGFGRIPATWEKSYAYNMGWRDPSQFLKEHSPRQDTTSGDTSPAASCGDGGVYDCIGQCVSESLAWSWVGDGYCDDGRYGMNLVCPEFNNDSGDCN